MKAFLLFLFIPVFSWSQNDSVTTLDYEAFITIVKNHHPMIYQAEIIANSGDAQVLKSRGNFDPKLEGSVQQKYYGGSQYYNLINGGLKIPTWFGISAKAGYDINQGVYLNPADRSPTNGLFYAGLEVELGSGLIIDQRRAELKKAKLYQAGTELERSMIRNELVKDASIAYWNWMNSYFQVQVYRDAILNSELRLNGVRESVIFGDRPAIDTIEANIQLQNRLFGFNDAKLELANSLEKLQLYLWQDGLIPLEIDNAIPVKKEQHSIKTKFSISSSQKDSLILQHPYLLLNDLKVSQYEIDLKLKQEQLKPSLTLKYNAITEPIGNNPVGNYSMSNYTWGGTLSYPILIRKERGDVKLAQLKLEDTKLSNTQLFAKLDYSIDISFNKFETSFNQLTLYIQTVQNYEQLYLAEKKLFNIGESSLFLLNIREKSYLEAQLKQIELIAKTQSAGHELYYQLMIDTFK